MSEIGHPAPTLDDTVAHHMEVAIKTMSYTGWSRDAVVCSIDRWREEERVRQVIHDALSAGPDHD